MVGGSLRSNGQPLLVGSLLVALVLGCSEDPVRVPGTPEPIDPQYIIWKADTYSGDGVVRVFWDASPMVDMPTIPPTPDPVPRSVHVEKSTEGANTGYRLVCSSATIGPDSVEVSGLENGVRYWFRILSYDAADRLVGASRPLETVPGPVPAPVAVVPAFQRNYLSRNLAWSPRGDKLVFAKAPGCVRENLYCYDFATAQVTPVTSFGADEQYLSHAGWSPDGSRLTFDYTETQTAYSLDYRIWMMPVDSNLPQSVSSGRYDADPAWVTNETLVFVRYTNSPRAPEIHRLVLGTEPQVTPLSADGRIWKQDLAVSRDGSTIAYTGAVYEEGSSTARSLYVLSTQGGASRALPTGGWWDDIHPAWHPDGRTLFFASDRCGHFEVWSLDLRANEVRQITRSQLRGETRYDPAPSPDGGHLALLASRGSPSTVEIVDIVPPAQ